MDEGCAKSSEMVFVPRFLPKPNYYFLAHLQCSLKFVCKFILCYFALSWQTNKQKYAKTVNLLYVGNKVFVKYQAQGGVLIHHPSSRKPLTLNIN